MIRWTLKWILRLFVLAVVLVVIFFLSLNSILRVVIEHNIHKQTGMDAEIGRFQLGIFEPTIEIQNLKIYNSTNFAGTPFLDIPEIHVEYDRAALAKKQIHVTLLRFNLGELDIVKNETGQTNIFSPLISAPPKSVSANGKPDFKKQTGYDFTGIDVLNISVGTAKFIDLKNPQNNRIAKIDIENLPMRNIKSPDDLLGLMVFVELRSNYFFTSVLGAKNSRPGNSATVQDILNLFGIAF